MNLLKRNPDIEVVEKNFLMPLCKLPNDPNFSKQWSLHNTGQTGGKVDADIDAPEAWNVFTGSSNVVVAVIDTGVDINHPDLKANIWVNSDEIAGDGIDNDNNGFIDDVRGYDFYDHDPDPTGTDSPFFHGTHVAGIIGAVGNNITGVSGVNWKVKIMPLRCGGNSGLPGDALIQAIDYSTENGAFLSSNSWGGSSDEPPSLLREAIARARNKGKLFVAAAGNDTTDIDIDPVYPACFDLSNILSVAATDDSDELASYSNYGRRSVDLGAPGGRGGIFDANDIYSTKNPNGYQFLAGTSMATPHVAGAAALVLGQCSNLSCTDIISILMNSADQISSLSGKTVSGGRLNLYNALPLKIPGSLTATALSSTQIKISWTDTFSHETGFEIQRKKAGGTFGTIAKVGANVQEFTDQNCAPNTTYNYRVRAYCTASTSWSNTATATTLSNIGIPNAPTNLTCTSTCNLIALSWTDNSNNEQGFLIERAEAVPNSPFVQIQSVGPNVTKIGDSHPCGSSFKYRVRAYNQAGLFAYSNEKGGATKPCILCIGPQ